jgi:type IV secretion system protein VirB3
LSDPNKFRILFIWIETREQMRNASLWGGSSYTPLRLIKHYRVGDFRHA